MDLCEFKSIILKRLIDRCRHESLISGRIIIDYETLQNRYVALIRQMDTLKYENERMKSTVPSPSEPVVTRKILELQEEVTNAIKEKGNLNIKYLELQLICNNKDKDIQELRQSVQALKEQISRLEELNRISSDSIKKLEEIKRTLTDEISANLMAYRALDNKYRSLEESNQVLKETVKSLQQKLEEKKNEEYDKRYKAQMDAVQRSLMEAANSPVDIDIRMKGPEVSIIPTSVRQSMEAHEGEMGAVRFSPSGLFLATSGSDRKIKIWSNSYNNCEYRNTLTGCNGSVIAVDYDLSEQFILGCSTLDSSCRLWSMGDFRMRLSLTGHSNKVVAGRFLSDNSKVVTGSTDRTLKLWDTKTRTCVKTMLAMSACHDVVSSGLGLIISGHFDKKLRMWDHRGDLNTDQLVLTGRITGLDISLDQNMVLACTKDDCMQIIDLRMNQLMQSFTAPHFKPGMDLVRPCFSPDGQFVVGGSHDGTIFVWNARTAKLEKVLKDHNSSIVCVHWSPTANVIASCERNRKVTIWSD